MSFFFFANCSQTSQSLIKNNFLIKVELYGHFLRKINLGYMTRGMQTDTGFDFAAKSADFKGEELSTC